MWPPIAQLWCGEELEGMVKLREFESGIWVPPINYRLVYPNYQLPLGLLPPSKALANEFCFYRFKSGYSGHLTLAEHDKYFGTVSDPEYLQVRIPILFGVYHRHKVVRPEYPIG